MAINLPSVTSYPTLTTGETSLSREGGLTVNKRIVVAVLVIGGVTVVNQLLLGKPVTRVILGAYVLLLILSLIDLIGGRAAHLAGMLAMLALVVVLLSAAGPLFQWIQQALGTQGQTGRAGKRTEAGK